MNKKHWVVCVLLGAGGVRETAFKVKGGALGSQFLKLL